MRGGTFFSGIGAPECAMPWVNWRWLAEIDPFASATHAARFPGVPNLGNVTQIDPGTIESVDLVVFGSPCQSFSVAGKRLGLDDPRGNLALIALRLIGRIRPCWVVFENVPGLLSSDSGRDFGTFLGLLGECGYGFAYRILDAQFAGVPQRRRRVFVVGYLGDWRPAAAVLFEPESLRGDPAPRRETGQSIAASLTCGADSAGAGGYAGRRREDDENIVVAPLAGCAEGGSRYRNDADTADNLIAYTVRPGTAWRGDGCDNLVVAFGGNRQSGPIDVATAVNAHGGPHGRLDFETETFVTHSLRADGFDAGEDGTGRGTPLTLAIRGRGDSHDLEYRGDGIANAVLTPNGGRAGIGAGAIALPTTVRRLTPRECERLQGFPDNWTAIQYRGKPAADGPRYRAIGNSIAVPVIGWIGHRIKLFEEVTANSPAKGCAA